jgi:hypothetical protein
MIGGRRESDSRQTQQMTQSNATWTIEITLLMQKNEQVHIVANCHT